MSAPLVVERVTIGPQGAFAQVPGLDVGYRLLTKVFPLGRGKIVEREGKVFVSTPVGSIYSFSALTWSFTGRQRVGTTIGETGGSRPRRGAYLWCYSTASFSRSRRSIGASSIWTQQARNAVRQCCSVRCWVSARPSAGAWDG